MTSLFSAEELQYVREHAATMSDKQMIDEMKILFGCTRTPVQLHGMRQREKIFTGRTGQFVKGQKPVFVWPKGTCHPNSAATQFKKGHIPANAKETGYEMTDVNGYRWVKTAEGFRQKSHVMYEQYHGVKLEKGTVILFLDQDKNNFSKDNLMKCSHGETATINRWKGLEKNDPELNRALVLTGRLEKLIKENEEGEE